MASEYFLTRYKFDKDREQVWKAICRYLSKYIPPESSVLDLGSGYGDFINNVEAKVKVAVDSNENAKAYCHQDVSFLNIKATEIEFSDNSFDVVFMSNLLEHLNEQDLKILISKIYSCLKPSGRLLIIQPNYYYAFREYWDDYTHLKAFSHVSIDDFLTVNGFKVVRLEKKFLPYSFRTRVPKSYFLTKLYLMSFWRPMAKQMLVIAEK